MTTTQNDNEPIRYAVIVGNIGCVYDGNSIIIAHRLYGEYMERSRSNTGRAAGENVTIFANTEIIKEYCGTLQDESDNDSQ